MSEVKRFDPNHVCTKDSISSLATSEGPLALVASNDDVIEHPAAKNRGRRAMVPCSYQGASKIVNSSKSDPMKLGCPLLRQSRSQFSYFGLRRANARSAKSVQLMRGTLQRIDAHRDIRQCTIQFCSEVGLDKREPNLSLPVLALLA
jgi:hypothetical protein